MKAALQHGQLYFLSPKCFILCLRRVLWSAKQLSHTSHLNGFSPVCPRVCVCSMTEKLIAIILSQFPGKESYTFSVCLKVTYCAGKSLSLTMHAPHVLLQAPIVGQKPVAQFALPAGSPLLFWQVRLPTKSKLVGHQETQN